MFPFYHKPMASARITTAKWSALMFGFFFTIAAVYLSQYPMLSLAHFFDAWRLDLFDSFIK
jgi:hypothetical protein